MRGWQSTQEARVGKCIEGCSRILCCLVWWPCGDRSCLVRWPCGDTSYFVRWLYGDMSCLVSRPYSQGQRAGALRWQS